MAEKAEFATVVLAQLADWFVSPADFSARRGKQAAQHLRSRLVLPLPFLPCRDSSSPGIRRKLSARNKWRSPRTQSSRVVSSIQEDLDGGVRDYDAVCSTAV